MSSSVKTSRQCRECSKYLRRTSVTGLCNAHRTLTATAAKRFRASSKGKEYRSDFMADRRKWRDDIKLKAGCSDCGYREHPAALDFDHLPGTVKSDNVGNLILNASRERALAEIAKCEVVCSNC